MDRALSVADSFRTNHPRCRSCGGPARPNLQLERGDVVWTDAADRSERYAGWKRALLEEAHAKTGDDGARPVRRVVIVEVGAFSREGDATTVRQESEALLRELNARRGRDEGGEWTEAARLVRINALYPLIDGARGDDGGACISVIGDELEALARIDEAFSAIRGGGGGAPV